MIIPKRIYHYFIPARLQDPLSDRYDQLCTVVVGFLVASVLLVVVPSMILISSPLALYYYIVLFICVSTLLYIKFTGRFMLMLILTMLTTYTIIVTNCLKSGGILSMQVSALYLLLLTAFWADRRVGKAMIFTNLAAILLLYFESEQTQALLYAPPEQEKTFAPESFETALLYHMGITLFFGIFFLMVYQQRDEAKRLLREQQLAKIVELNAAVRKRTEELLSLRKNLSRDFHDETGNILSAITRQASTLGLIITDNPRVTPIIGNIISNSEKLYASSKDFLWSINDNSGNPNELYTHLTAFGQVFYNQFDIAFSAEKNLPKDEIYQLNPSVSRHLVFMFKEAMTNAAKHAQCSEVKLTFQQIKNNLLLIILQDNGTWKDPTEGIPHAGIDNMKRRAAENGLELTIHTHSSGSFVHVEVTLTD